MRRVVLLLLCGLGACAHIPPKVVYQTVNMPVPVSCVPSSLGDTPKGLETPASLAAIPSGPERYARLTADWLARVARMAETEPIIDSCRKAAPPPP